MTRLIEKWEADYRAGHKRALRMAIESCRTMRWEWEAWMSSAVREVLEGALATGREEEIPSLLFGRETARKQRDAISAEGLLQCYERLEEMKHQRQLWAFDDGDANLIEILADFIAEFFDRPDGASSSTLEKQIRKARKNRRKVPGYIALGYEFPLMEFLSRKGYWRTIGAIIS